MKDSFDQHEAHSPPSSPINPRQAGHSGGSPKSSAKRNAERTGAKNRARSGTRGETGSDADGTITRLTPPAAALNGAREHPNDGDEEVAGAQSGRRLATIAACVHAKLAPSRAILMICSTRWPKTRGREN